MGLEGQDKGEWFRLKESRVRWEIRKKFSTMRVGIPRNRAPRAAVAVPKARPDTGAWRSLGQCKVVHWGGTG